MKFKNKFYFWVSRVFFDFDKYFIKVFYSFGIVMFVNVIYNCLFKKKLILLKCLKIYFYIE